MNKEKTILDFVREYDLDPKPIGDLYRVFCPFHEDMEKPNFTIWPRTNSWFCFACNFGGGIAKFISMIEDISIEEARNKLKGYDIDLEELNDYIDDIGTDEKEIVINDEVNILLSSDFRKFLQKYPNKIPDIFKIMEDVDQKLVIPIKSENVHKFVIDTRQKLEKVV